MIDIDLSALEELAARADRADAVLGQGLARGVRRAVEDGIDEARRTHRYVDRTGNLTQSLDGRVTEVGPLHAEGEMVAETDYASYVEKGTRFARPHPYMAQARTKAKRVLQEEVQDAVDDAVRELERG
jgi:hypothetical protein